MLDVLLVTYHLTWQLLGAQHFGTFCSVCLGVCAAMKCLCIYRNFLYSCNCMFRHIPVLSDGSTDTNNHSAPLHIQRQPLLVHTFSTDSLTACMALHKSHVPFSITSISKAVWQSVDFLASQAADSCLV